MNNLLSYCGLVDARISASEKDLPVHTALRGKIQGMIFGIKRCKKICFKIHLPFTIHKYIAKA